MKWILPACLLMASCAASQTNSVAESNDSTAAAMQDSGKMWMDELVMDFVESRDLVTGEADTGLTWIYDREEVTDTASYAVVKIGHSFEYRYITEAWLYIDKDRRTVYEYDIAYDSLIRYK